MSVARVTEISSTSPQSFEDAVKQGIDRELAKTIITAFLCPSDSGATIHSDSSIYYMPDGGADPSRYYAKSCYDFIVPDEQLSYCNLHNATTIETRYLFGDNSYARLSSCTDGLSNTFAMGEQTLETYNGKTPGWLHAGWVSVGIDPVGNWNLTFPAKGINVWKYSTAPAIPGRRASWYSCASLHTGGAHFLMGDGAVRYVSVNIDWKPLVTPPTEASYGTYNRLCDKADGYVVGDY